MRVSSSKETMRDLSRPEGSNSEGLADGYSVVVDLVEEEKAKGDRVEEERAMAE